jgi:hypothetical protein
MAISTDFHAELHALLNSQYCVPSEHQRSESGPRRERAGALKNASPSVRRYLSLPGRVRAMSDYLVSASGGRQRRRHSHEALVTVY